jgi:4-amino-4-deoxy-L-arabinose transferase-like glycosyltransferase
LPTRSEAGWARKGGVYAAKGLGMLSKFAATVLLSIVVFIVVTLFVSLGVLWLTGEGTRSVLIGVILGAVAVLAVRAVSWYGRSGEQRPGNDEHERSRTSRDR